MASKNPLHDLFPSRMYCGGDFCDSDPSPVECKLYKKRLKSCDSAFFPGAYVNDGYTTATCGGAEEIRVCKQSDADLGVWNDTREKYKNDPSLANATAVVNCCTASDGITENEKLNCGQMYQGGLGKDRGKRDCHILNSCGDPAKVEEPVCNRFAAINKGVPEYQKIALPWWNNWCQKQHSAGVGTSELVRYGCFDKNMETDDYEHTQGFYQQYIKSLDVFIPDDKHATKFCMNQNVIEKGWCDATLTEQCKVGSGNEYRRECSCFHPMNDNGPGYKNFKADGTDYKDLFKKDPAAAGVMAGTLQPICALNTCKLGTWKTKNQRKDTICPPCYQTNYNEGRGKATQTNNCKIIYKDGEFVVEEENDQPGGSSVDPAPKPQPGGSSVDPAPEPKERSSVQVSKGCNKFRKGPECKKLSGLSVGLIVSSVVLLFFLLMLFLFF